MRRAGKKAEDRNLRKVTIEEIKQAAKEGSEKIQEIILHFKA